MQTNWSDIDSNKSDSMTSKDQRYEQNDFLIFFIVSLKLVPEIDSEYEFIDEHNVSFLENIVVKYQCLIEKYLKTHDVLDSQKFKINLLCEEKINYIEKIWFLKFEFNLSSRETIF